MMKKKRNGFFLSETMIVMTVVAVVILGVFKVFSSVYTRYKESENYNTINSINALSILNQYYDSYDINILTILNGNYYVDLTNLDTYESEHYDNLKSTLNVDKVYLFDGTKLFSGENIYNFDLNTRKYLKTLSKKNYDTMLVVKLKSEEYASVEVKGNEIVTLVGDSNDEFVTYVELNTEFFDPGYINWIGDKPKITGSVDTTKEGTYYLTYDFNGYLLRRKVIVTKAVYNYDYTGGAQTFTAPSSGYYKLETWGAQGGTSLNNNVLTTPGGYGGYSKGVVYLKKGETLYIYVGGKGQDGTKGKNATGGYNGGGSGTWDTTDDESGGAGGGATHIAKASGLLSSLESNKSSILIVAGAGGGSSWTYEVGHGGGFTGVVTKTTNQSVANQVMGYAFGKGQNATGVGANDGVGGGGAGYYGGYSNDVKNKSAGAGGSGYIGNDLLTNKAMYCYGCVNSTSPDTYTVSTTNVSDNAIENYAKKGNGYARITLAYKEESEDAKTYNYTGNVQTYTVPKTGWYRIEAWGAAGNNNYSDYVKTLIPTKGGYTKGEIYLTKDEKLYVYVGGIRETFNCCTQQSGVGSGGATDIRLVSGDWNNADSLRSRIMVAGGAGGSYLDPSAPRGGSAGGLISENVILSYETTHLAGPTTQTSSGAAGTSGSVGGFGYAGTVTNIAYSPGGGGYYGGSGAAASAGGSSFISGYAGVNAIDSSGNHTNDTKHYSGKYFINGEMQAGVNLESGKARITYIGENKSTRNTKLDNVRYIKDCVSGNQTDSTNRWNEIQAIYNGSNIAKGKTATMVSGTLSLPAKITDGDIGKYATGNDSYSTGNCVLIDLGQSYNLDEVAVWRNYETIFNATKNTVTSVSSDNTNWTTIITDSKIETPEGKRMTAYYYDNEQNNILTNYTFSDYTKVDWPWDKTLNRSLGIVPTNWSSYNSGVEEPEKGYHARFDNSPFGYNMVVFPNLNSSINQTGRWMGIYINSINANVIKANATYEVVMDIYPTIKEFTVTGGIWHSNKNTQTYEFSSAFFTIATSKENINKWITVRRVITTPTTLNESAGTNLFIYGNAGKEGTAYVRNIKLRRVS